MGFLDCVGIARGFGIVLHCASIWFAFGERKEALARRCDGITGIANEYSVVCTMLTHERCGVQLLSGHRCILNV